VGTLYMAIPRPTSAPFDLVEVATGTALKTVLQVAPVGTDIRVHGWGISFDGVSATAEPVKVGLVDTANPSTTGTSLTPEEWEGTDGQASLAVGGAALTAYNLTVEPTETVVRYLDGQEVHPQTGYSVFWPEARHPSVKAGRFLKVRLLAAATVNCLPFVLWEEPA
jgi:hypothetical protein